VPTQTQAAQALSSSSGMFLLKKLGFEEVDGALSAIQRIAAAKPELSLDRVMEQDVTPLRFRKVGATTDY
jgi:hypothetical protein